MQLKSALPTWEISLHLPPFQEHLFCQHFDHQRPQPEGDNGHVATNHVIIELALGDRPT